MGGAVGRGLLGSLRKRVQREVAEQQKGNRSLRRSRYSMARRTIRGVVVGRSLGWYAGVYLALDLLAVLAETLLTKYAPQYLPCWHGVAMAGRLKDVSGFLISAQVGLLAIVSVAVGVVTLISQRDDSSSTNTDVRLYYSESLAYEVVASSACLLVLLVLQEFWPLQFLSHRAGWGGDDQVFKVALTVLHIAWFVFNTLLFGQFLVITLRFVEPTARTLMRERYTANILAPKNNFDRLICYLYQTAPRELFAHGGSQVESPYITFGYGLVGHEGRIEIESTFSAETALHDVWLCPLSFVLRRWIKRTQAMPDQRGPRNVLGRRLVQLVFRPDFAGRYEDRFGWVIRLGGADFHAWELCLIRNSFRFRAVGRQSLDLPTPSDLLEELFDKVVGQIEKLAETGFRAALLEAADYHRFLIAIHNSKDSEGRPLNFAQFGGIFEAPFQEWVRLYRRVLEKAIEKSEADDYFIDFLSHIIMRLLPRDAREVATPVVISLLDIGVHEIVLLEAWFTRHLSDSAAEGRRGLPGSTQRAYEAVVLEFVGAWENVLKSTDTIYNWSGAKRDGNEPHWTALTQSWPFMQRHLQNTAYYLALAIWNEDSIGTARYRDVLVRWRDAFRFDTHGEYVTRRKDVLGADLFNLTWPQVLDRMRPFKQYDNAEDLAPGAIMALALRNVHSDVILLTAAIALRWHMQEASDISATAAAALVHRQISEDDGARFGEPLPSVDIYSAIWTLFLRSAAGIYGDGTHHRAEMDGLIRTLSQMAERRMISGRIYSSTGSDGVDSVYPQLCAMLAALLPAAGDEQALAWIREVAAMPELLAGGDRGLQRLVDRLRTLRNSLENIRATDGFARGVRALNSAADVAAVAARLDALIGSFTNVISTARDRRLIAAPLDPAKVEHLRGRLEAVITQRAMVLSCFQSYDQVESDQPTDEELSLRVNGVDKADFITPTMSLDPNSGWSDLVVQNFAEAVGNMVWRSFWHRPWTDVPTAAVAGSPEYWELVLANSNRVGEEPVLLAPTGVGNEVIGWLYGRRDEAPAGLTVTTVQGRNSGLGAGYTGTVNAMDVFSMHLLPNDSRLVSSRLLQTVVYHPLPTGRLVEVEFQESDDPRRPVLIVRFALKAIWHRYEGLRILTNGWDGNTQTPAGEEE